MRLTMRCIIAAALVLCAALCGEARITWAAADWPTRPVRFIVTLGAGSGADIGARLFADRLSQRWGQPVVVENRPGGDGIVAINAFVGARDDHVLLFSPTASFTAHPFLHDHLPYQPSDLVPVTRVSNTVIAISAPSSLNVNSLDQLIAMAKSAPDTITFASAGPGSPHQMAMELLLNRAGVKMVHVPYKGASPALKDLISGEVPVMMLDVATAREPIKAGLLKVLASAAPERSAEFPNVRTIAEAGFPGYEASAWQGIVAPAKTPHEIIEKLNGQIGAALADPAVKQRLQAAGIEPIQSTPESFAAYMQSETLKWQGVIKAANISLN